MGLFMTKIYDRRLLVFYFNFFEMVNFRKFSSEGQRPGHTLFEPPMGSESELFSFRLD